MSRIRVFTLGSAKTMSENASLKRYKLLRHRDLSPISTGY